MTKHLFDSGLLTGKLLWAVKITYTVDDIQYTNGESYQAEKTETLFVYADDASNALLAAMAEGPKHIIDNIVGSPTASARWPWRLHRVARPAE